MFSSIFSLLRGLSRPIGGQTEVNLGVLQEGSERGVLAVWRPPKGQNRPFLVKLGVKQGSNRSKMGVFGQFGASKGSKSAFFRKTGGLPRKTAYFGYFWPPRQPRQAKTGDLACLGGLERGKSPISQVPRCPACLEAFQTAVTWCCTIW